MYVKTEVASLFTRIVERFGLPEPTSTDYEEVFGWYHFDDETMHLSYNPATQVWDVKRDRGCGPRPLNATWAPEELDEVKKLMDTLEMMAPPPLPASSSTDLQAQLFEHNGWFFGWYYFPQLQRWELAAINKL